MQWTEAEKIISVLAEEIPQPKSELNYGNNFQLLCAVILSAQCTDKRVNQITPRLFAEAPTPQLMSEIAVERLEEIIHSCGFYHHKAQFLHSCALDICTRFNGEVPSTLEELISLKGVGRKTANVVYSVAFGGQAIAVDTHVFRVANRLGLTTANNVLDTEKQLMELLPKEKWGVCHHYLLLFGRYVCRARNPKCKECRLTQYCKQYEKE